LIDLHTHTTESDGTFTPRELVEAAIAIGLEALAITDHDTFAGYAQAEPIAQELGLRLLCGIELSTALGNPKVKTVHLLGYFLHDEPSAEFHAWIAKMQSARLDRNVRLAARLQSLNVDIRLQEVLAAGRSIAGRPHFAKLLVQKGYCGTIPEAFKKFLDESAPGFVEREEPGLEEAIRRIRDAGGIPSLAHPIRLGKRDQAEEERLIAGMCDAGLMALEAYHSDHDAEDTERYIALARKYGMLITGGSDFHGAHKPLINLGTGFKRNLKLPMSLLDALLQEGVRELHPR